MDLKSLVDPIKLGRVLWPHITLYNKEKEIVESVWNNKETTVVAGNKLGKDLTAAYIVLTFFLTRHPVRIVTTSVDFMQLRSVLWGEIRRLLHSSRFPLTADRGGPIIENELHLRKKVDGKECGLSYVIGRVSAKGEGMLGHHVPNPGDGIPRTLFIADEASGVDDETEDKSQTWADRKLFIGNPYDCRNFFRKNEAKGDIKNEDKENYHHKLIRIKATDSPNVRYGMECERRGIKGQDRLLVPGVLSYDDYKFRRKYWDKVRQSISLDAEFYQGTENLLYPPEWLNRAESIARQLKFVKRKPEAIGIDVGQGSSNTCWCLGDKTGVIELISKKTLDTTIIPNETIWLMEHYGIQPERVYFDLGGGGKQYVDDLRNRGYNVKGIGFGETATINPQWNYTSILERIEVKEANITFANKRAEMAWLLREAITPGIGYGFGIPEELTELRKQMALIPLQYDREGKFFLPPKNRKPGDKSRQRTLVEMIGHSPDELDSLFLLCYSLFMKRFEIVAGAL